LVGLKNGLFLTNQSIDKGFIRKDAALACAKMATEVNEESFDEAP